MEWQWWGGGGAGGCRYSKMQCDEIVQERYAKYRSLGMWTEYKTYGLQYQQEKLRRATVWPLALPSS